MALGLAFQPGTMGRSQSGASPTGSTPGSVSPLQEAIQLLSLRLPSRVAPNAVAPLSLLLGTGGAGLPGASGMGTGWQLEQLRRILGIGQPAAPSHDTGSSDPAGVRGPARAPQSRTFAPSAPGLPLSPSGGAPALPLAPAAPDYGQGTDMIGTNENFGTGGFGGPNFTGSIWWGQPAPPSSPKPGPNLRVGDTWGSGGSYA